MKRLNTFISKWGMLFAFMLLAGAGMYAINSEVSSNANTLYQTQIATCVRGNKVRTESNDRIKAHTIDRDVLSQFLASAEAARRASGTPTDLAAANKYHKLRNDLKYVQFNPQQLIDCRTQIRKP